MGPYFIVFDLDGTLIGEYTRKLIENVEVSLNFLKQQGHFLSVCSNNAILKELNILEYFDFVIGHSSSTDKAVELLECWKFYRYLYRIKETRWKINFCRMIFVDNDEEIRQATEYIYKPIRLFASVENLIANFTSVCSKFITKKLSITAAKVIITKCHGNLCHLKIPTVKTDEHTVVYLSNLGRSKTVRHGTTNMKFHLTLNCSGVKRCQSTVMMTAYEAKQYGHSLCMICDYNALDVLTHKFCAIPMKPLTAKTEAESD